MKKLLLLVLSIALLSGCASNITKTTKISLPNDAPTSTNEREVKGIAVKNCEEIQATDYRVDGIAPVNTLHSFTDNIGISSTTVKNEILADLRDGVNFAGHYSVSSWSCGENCQNHAIIEAASGKMSNYGLQSIFGVEYSTSSRLLITNPQNNIPSETELVPDNLKTSYYTIDESSGELNLICEIEYQKINNHQAILGDYRDKCAINSDCIPTPDCHPKNCINKDFAKEYTKPSVCTDLVSCQAAYKKSDCACENGLCINLNQDKDCSKSTSSPSKKNK